MVKVRVCPPIVMGSIPTLAMSFLRGFHKCYSFSRERENRMIYLINKSFPVLNVKKIKNGVKSI